MTTDTWFDANDASQYQAFDDQLWKALEAGRAWREQEAGPAEATLGMFAANHGRLWELVAERGDPDSFRVSLKIVPEGQGANVVVRLVGRDGAEQTFTVPGLELISPG